MTKNQLITQIKAFRNENRKLREQVGKLIRIFKQYSKHYESCGINDKRANCTCGLERDIEELK